MRSLALALGLLLVGCSAEVSTSETGIAHIEEAPKNDALVAAIRDAYEAAGGTSGDDSGLTDAVDVPFRDLPGAAREAFAYYAGTHGIAMLGGPIARAGTIGGARIYFVAGDVSDTGSEFGFYDSDGKLLALAYAGQGAQPGPGGVDWLE